MHYKQEVLLSLDNGDESRMRCSWSWNRPCALGRYVTLDLSLASEAPSVNADLTNGSPTETMEQLPLLVEFLTKCLRTRPNHAVNMKCILPTMDGYITRSDFLECRLQGCDFIEMIEGFVEPCTFVHSIPNNITSMMSLKDIAQYFIGCILLPTSSPETEKGHSTALENLLQSRLSFEWLSLEPVKKTRVVWVGGRALDAGNHVLETSTAMGISLVVEHPGHRLQDGTGPGGRLREAFIPMDMTTDAGFVDRLVTAIRSHAAQRPIDGLQTIDEIYLTQVAKACEILKLPSSPPECYTRALDKFKTRMLELDTHDSFRVFGIEDLRHHLNHQSHRPNSLSYPKVVKPCVGWGSQCVTKVHNEDELFAAVQKASDRHASPNSLEWYEPRTDVVIEPYIDGPEVDANFVLLEGELLFYEISDDFPSPADVSCHQQQDNFLETVQLIPSNLPQFEQNTLRDSIYLSILRQGFKSGVFHCEARVQGSSMQYTIEEGLLDLRRKHSVAPLDSPKTYLHEINPRPPAYQSSLAILGAYGVDYYALQLALCIDDKTRFRAFTMPFCASPQHTVAVKYLHEPVPGVMATEDAGADLLRREPRLKPNIPLYKTLKRKGDRLEGPSGAVVLSFPAYFLVISKVSRKDCLVLMKTVQEEFQFALE